MASVLIINFDGVDGSTTYTEVVSGLTPSWSLPTHAIDTDWSKFGSGSLQFGDALNISGQIAWNIPPNSGDMTAHFWIHPGMGFQAEISLFDKDDAVFSSVAIGFDAAETTLVAHSIDRSTNINETLDPISGDSHIAIVVESGNLMLFVNGGKLGTWAMVNGMAGIDRIYFIMSSGDINTGYPSLSFLHIDALEVTDDAKWDADFTPPTDAPGPVERTLSENIVLGGDFYTNIQEQFQTENVTLGAVFSCDSYLDPLGEINFTLPMLTLSARRGSIINTSLPALSLYSAGRMGNFGRVLRALPSLTLTASGHSEGIGTLSSNLPPLSLIATGHQSDQGSVNLSLPKLTLSAHGFAGVIGRVSFNLPSITLKASGYSDIVAILSLPIPFLTLSARAHGEFTALVLNTENMGLSRYNNYDFNSLCNFKGQLLGLSPTGLYALDDSASTEQYDWLIDLGRIDFMGSRMAYAWLTGKADEKIKLTITTDTDSYEYIEDPISEEANELRFKVGKGLDDRYLSIKLSNANENVALTLDRFKIFIYDEVGKR